MSRLICLGKIVAAHGIKGQVKVRIFTNTPDNFTKYGPLVNEKQEYIPLTNLVIKSPNSAIASIDGIINRNQAEILNGTQLFIFEHQLPPPSEDEVYYEQLIGLPLLANEQILGHVVGVFDFGAGAFCEIKTQEGKIGTIHLTSCTVLADKLECDKTNFLI